MNKDNNTSAQNDILISFCLPVYNVEEFVGACIDSITAQNLADISYEILCVDDKSSDNSLNVLRKLSPSCPPLRIVENEENRGVSYTRNRLISLARGKYIWFVDPDDLLYPNCVRRMLALIEDSNIPVILGNYINCSEDAKLEEFHKAYKLSYREVSTDTNDYLPHHLTNGKRMCAVPMGLFRKDFLVDNSLCFQEGMIAQEDTLFYYQFGQRTHKVLRYDPPCYIYRQRSTSVMHSKSSERSKKYYASMRIMYDVYLGHLERGDYRDKAVLLDKLHHMKQNIAVCLALIPDTKYVKNEFKGLKKSKLYPYPMRKSALRTKESLPRRILFYLQPISPFFWLLHYSNKLMNK